MPTMIREDSSTFSFQTSAAMDFRATVKRNGRPMSHALAVMVAGAGTVELRLKLPRDGAETETFVLTEGQTLPGKFVEIVSAESACFPITVWGV